MSGNKKYPLYGVVFFLFLSLLALGGCSSSSESTSSTPIVLGSFYAHVDVENRSVEFYPLDETDDFSGASIRAALDENNRIDWPRYSIYTEECAEANFNETTQTLSNNFRLWNFSDEVGYGPELAFAAPLEVRLTSINEEDAFDLERISTNVGLCTNNGELILNSTYDGDNDGLFDCIGPEDTANTEDDPGWTFSDKIGTDHLLTAGEKSECVFVQWRVASPTTEFGFTFSVLGNLASAAVSTPVVDNIPAGSNPDLNTPTNQSSSDIFVEGLTGGLSDSVTIEGGLTPVTVNQNGSGSQTVSVDLIPNQINTLSITQNVGGQDSPAAIVTITQDNVAPTVTAVIPTDGSTNVDPSTYVLLTFSEPLNSSSVDTSTIRLRRGGTTITGTVTLGSNEYQVTFLPNSDLRANQDHTITVLGGASGVTDLAGNVLSTDFVSTFRTGGNGVDDEPPYVVSSSPSNNATLVPPSISPSMAVNEPLDSSSVTLSNACLIFLNPSVTLVSINGPTLSADGKTITFDPTSDLSFNTEYWMVLENGSGSGVCSGSPSGIEDLAGNNLLSQTAYSFTIAGSIDTTQPEVVDVVPANGSVGVSENVIPEVVFSEAVDPATVNTNNFQLRRDFDNTPLSVSVSLAEDGITVLIDPLDVLENDDSAYDNNGDGVEYLVSVSANVTDLAGNHLLTPATFEFTTAPAPDTTAPFVTSTIPADGNGEVPRDTDVWVEFSEPMNPVTVGTNSIIVREGGFLSCSGFGSPIAGEVELLSNQTTAHFTLSGSRLSQYRCIRIEATTDNEDIAGNSLNQTTYAYFITLGDDRDPPSVVSIYPPDDPGCSNPMPTNINIAATFDELIDGSTVTGSTFYLSPSTSSVVSMGSDLQSATLNPVNQLSTSTTYTVVLTNGIRDASSRSNRLEPAPVTSTFCTGNTTDYTRPTVLTVSPVDESTGEKLVVNVDLNFSEAIDPNTITTTSLKLRDPSSAIVPANVSVLEDGETARLNPISVLNSLTEYTVVGTTAIRDLAGNALQNHFESTFSTLDGSSDTTAPRVVTSSLSPGYNANNVDRDISSILIPINENVDPDTINTVNVTLYDLWLGILEQQYEIEVSLDPDLNTIRIHPLERLGRRTTIYIRISGNITDEVGNYLNCNDHCDGGDYLSRFTTGNN